MASKKKELILRDKGALPCFLSVSEIAVMFHVGKATVRLWHSKGVLPKAKKIGRRLLWSCKDIENFFDSLPNSKSE